MMQNPWGYEARPIQTSKSIENTVGTYGFAKPCVPTVFFEIWESLASYPKGVHVIDDVKPLGI
jgi:hypothetical protein